MTKIISPRPSGLGDIISKAALQVCQTHFSHIERYSLMAENIEDCYDPSFLVDGQSIYDKLKFYGWRLTVDEIGLLDTIDPLVSQLEYERELTWYRENVEALHPTYVVGDSLNGGTVVEVGLDGEGLVATYLIKKEDEGSGTYHSRVHFEDALS